MRKMLTVAIAAAAALVVMPVASLAAAQDVKSLLLTALKAEKSVTLTVDGRESVSTTSPKGDVLVAIDPNKNYVVYEGECSYVIVEQNPGAEDNRCPSDQNAQAASTDSCKRCRRVAGWIIKGRWQPNDLFRTPAPGFHVRAFGFGSAKVTSIANGDGAEPVIATRFQTAGYNPNWSIDIDKQGTGPGAGGGLDLSWRKYWGVRVGVAWEKERNALRQTVQGERTLNGLRFAQQGSSDIGSTMVFFGPTFRAPGGFVFSGGPTVSWWNVSLRQTATLQALCPSPCQTVRTDDLTEKAGGSDVGFHLGAEYFPGNSWYGFYSQFARTRYKGVYDPDRPLAYPRDWTDHNLFLGATVRTKSFFRR